VGVGAAVSRGAQASSDIPARRKKQTMLVLLKRFITSR